jgi:hypothetical protein
MTPPLGMRYAAADTTEVTMKLSARDVLEKGPLTLQLSGAPSTKLWLAVKRLESAIAALRFRFAVVRAGTGVHALARLANLIYAK